MAIGPNTTVTHDDFVPEIWVARTIDAFEKKLLARGLFDDWSAYFAGGGKTAYIPIFKNLATTDAASIPESTEAVYAATASTSDKLTLEIDQGKYVTIEITDALATFNSPDLIAKWSSKLAYPLAALVDAYFFEILSDASGNAPLDLTSLSGKDDDDIMEVLKNAKLALDEQDVPLEDRRWIFDPKLANRAIIIKQIASADYTKSASVETGKLGMLMGSPVFMSTNLHSDTYSGLTGVTNLYCHADALAFAFGPRPLEVLYRPNDAHFVNAKITAKVRYGAVSVNRDGTHNYSTVNIVVS